MTAIDQDANKKKTAVEFWFSKVRPTVCGRACEMKSKRRSCSPISVCQDCQPYLCKFLTHIVGLESSCISGDMPYEDQLADKLANFYWNKLMRAKCSRNCQRMPPLQKNKPPLRCWNCIKRYQMSTYFIPGNIEFRNNKTLYKDQARRIDLRKLRDQTLEMLLNLIVKLTPARLETNLANSAGHFTTDILPPGTKPLMQTDKDPLAAGNVYGQLLEVPLSAEESGNLNKATLLMKPFISRKPSTSMTHTLTPIHLPGLESVILPMLSPRDQSVMESTWNLDWDVRLDAAAAAAVGNCLETLTGLTIAEVEALKVLRALRIDLFKPNTDAAVGSRKLDYETKDGLLKLIPMPVNLHNNEISLTNEAKQAQSYIQELIDHGPPLLPTSPEAYYCEYPEVQWSGVDMAWWVEIQTPQPQIVAFPTGIWPFGAAKALAMAFARQPWPNSLVLECKNEFLGNCLGAIYPRETGGVVLHWGG